MAHDPVCDGCGIFGERRDVRPVPVTPRAPSAPEVGHLLLCRACRTGSRRTWRMRWSPTETV